METSQRRQKNACGETSQRVRKNACWGNPAEKTEEHLREEPGRESVRERMGKNDEIIDQAEGVFLDGHL